VWVTVVCPEAAGMLVEASSCSASSGGHMVYSTVPITIPDLDHQLKHSTYRSSSRKTPKAFLSMSLIPKPAPTTSGERRGSTPTSALH
jgi:hypothetical protein